MENNLQTLLAAANQIILGKEQQIRMAVCCLLANGHLLIEDLPGVGKTTLSHALAKLFGMSYQRIQFTSDILPADIIGSSVFVADQQRFQFHAGPVFKQMVLADEINRATPKAQSALLEAMEERQVSVDGVTYPLPVPFFVIATQNPSYHLGTFPLPESQLDRFLMRIELGYPSPEAELALLAGESRQTLLETLPTCVSTEELIALQKSVREVYTSRALLGYVQAIISFTRQSGIYPCGLSPRAGLALVATAKAWAWMGGRAAVMPEDVQAVLPAVAGHRLRAESQRSEETVEPILHSVPVL